MMMLMMMTVVSSNISPTGNSSWWWWKYYGTIFKIGDVTNMVLHRTLNWNKTAVLQIAQMYWQYQRAKCKKHKSQSIITELNVRKHKSPSIIRGQNFKKHKWQSIITEPEGPNHRPRSFGTTATQEYLIKVLNRYHHHHHHHHHYPLKLKYLVVAFAKLTNAAILTLPNQIDMERSWPWWKSMRKYL